MHGQTAESRSSPGPHQSVLACPCSLPLLTIRGVVCGEWWSFLPILPGSPTVHHQPSPRPTSHTGRSSPAQSAGLLWRPVGERQGRRGVPGTPVTGAAAGSQAPSFPGSTSFHGPPAVRILCQVHLSRQKAHWLDQRAREQGDCPPYKARQRPPAAARRVCAGTCHAVRTEVRTLTTCVQLTSRDLE